MKRVKKDAASFKQLGTAQMREITGGGYWAIITTPEGQVIRVWVP